MLSRKILLRLLRNTSFIFILSVFCGLAFPSSATVAEPFMTPALMVMMAFSLTEVHIGLKDGWSGSFSGLILNYGILSGLIIALSSTITDEAVKSGFIVMAAVPPAISILPMTRLLKGDVRLSLYSEVLSYLAALLLMPGIIYLFAGKSGVDPLDLAEIALLLILFPALVSRFIRFLPINPVFPINLGFFLVTYTVIGVNQPIIWNDIGTVAPIALARTFGIGIAIYIAAVLARKSASRRISYTLLGSSKNLGLAAVVAMMLFGPEAGVPCAVSALAETAFFIFLAAAKPR